MLAGAAAIFTSARLARNSSDVTSLARIPAITLGMAAVVVQVGLQFGDAAINGYELGGLLLAVGLVAIAVDAPWTLRLPFAAGLFAAGTSIILREAIVTTQLGATFVDTAALGTFGLALITGTLLKGKAKGLVLQGALGHTFVLAALGRSPCIRADGAAGAVGRRCRICGQRPSPSRRDGEDSSLPSPPVRGAGRSSLRSRRSSSQSS